MTTSAGSTPQDPRRPHAGADLAAELRESREQLAAVNEVLSAVGRSAGDPDMVLTTIVDSARRLCRAHVVSNESGDSGAWYFSVSWMISRQNGSRSIR